VHVKDENIVVVAGAGAGKTYTLVKEYVCSLLGLRGECTPCHPREILAVTFTDKAASEMRTRVQEWLKALIDDDAGIDPVAQFGREVGRLLPEKDVMRRILGAVVNGQISTFHAFCGDLLRQYASEAALDPDFELMDPNDEFVLLLECAQALFAQRQRDGDARVDSLLGRYQLRDSGGGVGLVEAFVRTYEAMREHGVSPVNLVLASALPNPSMSIDAILSEFMPGIQSALGFYGSPSVRLSDVAKVKIGRAKSAMATLVAILEQKPADMESALSHALSGFKDATKGAFGPKEMRQNLLERTLLLSQALCDFYSTKESTVIRDLLCDFDAAVFKRKNEMGVLGFSDLLVHARDLLSHNHVVRNKVKKCFRRIMVDEFQDTSPLQEDLVALLAEDTKSCADIPKGKRAMDVVQLGLGRLFVVGDPKQSIYGFRGADVHLFQHTLDVVTKGANGTNASGVRANLSLSRRSQKDAVDVVNAVAKLTLPLGNDGISFDDTDALDAVRKPLGNAGAIWQTAVSDSLPKDKALAFCAASGVMSLVEDGISPGDIAVLVRRVKSATEIGRNLHKAGISYRVVGGVGFYKRQEIRDVLAALHLSVAPFDVLSSLTILRSPFLALSESALTEILTWSEDESLNFNWIKVSRALSSEEWDSKTKTVLEGFDALLKKVKAHIENGEHSLALDLLLNEGRYAGSIGVCDDADLKWANIEKLRGILAISDAIDSKIIFKLWDKVRFLTKEGLATMLGDDASVQLMTIHQSKGLEFEHVVLADTLSAVPNARGDFAFDPEVGLALSVRGRPISAIAPKSTKEKALTLLAIDKVRKRQKERQESELSRLLYVAMTRARDKIYFVEAVDNEGKAQTRGTSLKTLFDLGVSANHALFETLMPTQRFQHSEIVSLKSKHKKRLAKIQVKLPKAQNGPLLFFASELKGLRNHVKSHGENGPLAHMGRHIGDLAHRVMMHAGQQLTPKTCTNESATAFIDGAFRFEAPFIFKHGISAVQLDVVKHACLTTLLGPLGDFIKAKAQLMFEAPLVFWPNGNRVIEGRADCIIQEATRTIIVDFKSSRQQAVSPSTILQLNVYAKGYQAQNCSNDVFIVPLILGLDSPLQLFVPTVTLDQIKNSVSLILDPSLQHRADQECERSGGAAYN